MMPTLYYAMPCHADAKKSPNPTPRSLEMMRMQNWALSCSCGQDQITVD